MKLVKFDRTKNISFFGECKLQFNGPDKCLYLKLLDKEETFTVMFNRIFICKNNFLCCINQNFKHGLILVFSTKEKCEQIFNGILKVKSRYSQLNIALEINENEVFKENFFLPLVKAAKNVINGFEELKTIIFDFVNAFDLDERIHYLNVLAQILFVPTSDLLKHEKNVKDENQIVNPISRGSSSKTAFMDSRKHRMRKRSLNNISYKENDDENENNKNQSKKLKKTSFNKVSQEQANLFCFDEPTPKNSPNDVIFEIVQSLHEGNLVKKLLLFVSNERKECYEFLLNRNRNIFQCIRCRDKKKNIFIRSIIHENGSKSYNFNTPKHVCAPIKNLPENYQSSFIIHSPNFKFVKREFNGKMYPLLSIFDSDDRSLCYEFGFDRSTKIYRCLKCNQYNNIKFIARFIQHDGKTAVELNRLQHLCQPQKYVP